MSTKSAHDLFESRGISIRVYHEYMDGLDHIEIDGRGICIDVPLHAPFNEAASQPKPKRSINESV